MSLRWILPTVALALPALAQDPGEPAAPIAEAPAAAPVAAPEPAPDAAPAPSAAAAPTATPPSAAEPVVAPAPKPEPTRAPKQAAQAPAEAPAAAPVARKAPVPPLPNEALTGSTPTDDVARAAAAALKTAPPEVQKAVQAAAAQAARTAENDRAREQLEAARALEAETPEQVVARISRIAFEKFLSADASYLVRGAGFPFYLDGRRFDEREPLFRELLQQLRARRTDLLSVDAIEVLTPDQMEKKHGRPPARLAALPWRAPNTWIAIGNLSGVPVVALFQQHPRSGWQLVAFTD